MFRFPPRALSGEEFRAELHAMRRRRNPEVVARANARLAEFVARERAHDAADRDAALAARLARAHGYLPSTVEG